ncbi:unnamed protein product [Pedinophyceae sp. YPF-701]|nr:unnamed protein product [Pedinophyceae sp. YPF-701]
MSGRDAASAAAGYHQIVIIGAGVSGLYAARRLKQLGIHDVLIVEAHGRAGGRVHEERHLVPWALPIGAEFVHGSEHNIVVEDMLKMGVTFEERQWPDWFYDRRERRLMPPAEVAEDDELQEVMEMFDSIAEEEEDPLPDITAEEWLRKRGASAKQIEAADAIFANDFGTGLAGLGVAEMLIENRLWRHGPAYLTVKGSFSSVVQNLAKGARIRHNWPVQRVSVAPEGGRAAVTLFGPNSERLRCDRAIVTVSVAVLASGAIQFDPALPDTKVGAARRIRLGNAIKLILAFKDKFWPEEMYDVVCPGCFVPEIWMLEYPPERDADGRPVRPAAGGTCCVVCFIAGERADQVTQMPPELAAKKCLDQLDEMFRTKEGHTPASDACVDWRLYDWAKDPYALGAYTYPCYGAQPGDRAALAAPACGGRVHFAGEASHHAVNPCIQAAAETGVRAAEEAAKAVSGEAVAGRPVSRL